MEDVCYGDKKLSHRFLGGFRFEGIAGGVLPDAFGVGHQEDSQVGQYAEQVSHKDAVVL